MKNCYTLFRLLLILLASWNMSASAQTTYTFNYTGSVQTWTVPPGATIVAVSVAGASGGLNGQTVPGGSMADSPGHGGCVVCTLSVTPGTVLDIYVGGAGANATTTVPGVGGYNGGAAGGLGYVPYCGGGGGGASDIRIPPYALTNRVVVGAGGGGAGGDYFLPAINYEKGGDGGGTTGENGKHDNLYNPEGGGGGTPLGGGIPGTYPGWCTGIAGTLGLGAAACNPGGGGGGGGGYYGGGGGAWGGGGGGSNYADPSLATTVVHTRGCNSARNGYVTITLLCSAPPIRGTRGMCIGGSTTLTDTTGGTWSSSNPSVATIGSTSGIVSGIAVGTATITYTVTLPCGTVSTTAVVTVNPLPAPITGTLQACVGGTSVLTSASGGGTWTSSVLGVATIGSTTGIATGAAPGTTMIIYTLPTTCTTSAIFTTNPNPPAITGTTNLCTGSTTSLSDGVSGGRWSSSNPAVGTIDTLSGILAGLTVGTTTVSYTLSSGCYTTALVTVVGISGATHVCMYDSVTLTATSGGGTWSTSNPSVASITSAGVLHGISMGAIEVSYTLPSGCTALWAFTVNPLAPIVGRDSVCVLSNGYLTDIVGGGTWSSSITSVATVLPDSGKVTGLAAGITTISYLLPTGCLSTVSFTVIAYPGPITGIMQVCPQATTTLSDASGGGTWSSSNTAVATVDPATGVVTGVFADTVDIIYTLQPGCPTFHKVVVNPLPDPITGPSVICPGTSDTMRDATPNGLWSSSVLPTATIVDTNGIVSALTGGTTVIQYQLPTGCFQHKTLSVDPIPVPAITYDNWLNTFFASPGYVSYQWYDSSQGKIPGATSPTLAAAQYMYYWVVVTDSNGCMGASPYFYYHLTTVGVKNFLKSSDVKIYPNPATTTLYITAPVKVRATITSVDGKQEIDMANAKAIDISNLANGVYIVTIYDEEGIRVTVQKLVKE